MSNTKQSRVANIAMVVTVSIIVFGMQTTKVFGAKKTDKTKPEIRKLMTLDEIAKETIKRLLPPMERFKGKAMMLPQVVASLGTLRYAEAIGDEETIKKIKELYLAAYRDGKNNLSYGHLEDQISTIVPMELYRLTGDKKLLDGCKAVVEGQRLNTTQNGVYRHLRYRPSDALIIVGIQSLGSGIFNDKTALDFGAKSLINLAKGIAPRERYALQREMNYPTPQAAEYL